MQRENRDTAVIIAAFNEAKVVPTVVKDLCKLGFQVIVVDDGSTDDTRYALRDSGAIVCRHPINLGQGAALQTGLNAALRGDARYFATFDADGQHDPKDLDALLEPLRCGRTQVALGTRFAAGGRAIDISYSKRFLLRAAILFTKATVGIKVTDTHNGLRAFTREAAAQLHITQNRMAHATQILSQIRTTGLSYVEVPVNISYTPYSRQKGQPISNFFNILWEMLEGYLGL